jgi:hypothetical protein
VPNVQSLGTFTFPQDQFQALTPLTPIKDCRRECHLFQLNNKLVLPGVILATCGTIAMLTAALAGVFGAGVYCHAPDVYSYASGHAVRAELAAAVSRGKLTLFLCTLYLSLIGVWLSGPMVITIAGLPLYTILVIVFVGGFSYICCKQKIQIPEMVTAPFLCLGLVHNFPDLQNIGGAAVGLTVVLIARWVLGLIILLFRTATNDAEGPRLYGLISDDTWLFFAGAAAWVGQDHIVGLIVCCTPIAAIGLILSIIDFPTDYETVNRNRLSAEFGVTHNGMKSIVIPWGGLITMAMLMEMVIRHECSQSTLGLFLPSSISNRF